MPEYLVNVTRTSYAMKQIIVEADDEIEAREKAEEKAGDCVFTEHFAEYEAEDVSPVLEKREVSHG